MTYEEPADRRRGEIEADLNSSQVETVQRALMDAAHHLEGDWVQPRALALSHDQRLEVRQASVIALSVLARRRRLLVDPELEAAIARLKEDAEVVGVVQDLLDDLSTFS